MRVWQRAEAARFIAAILAKASVAGGPRANHLPNQMQGPPPLFSSPKPGPLFHTDSFLKRNQYKEMKADSNKMAQGRGISALIVR